MSDAEPDPLPGARSVGRMLMALNDRVETCRIEAERGSEIGRRRWSIRLEEALEARRAAMLAVGLQPPLDPRGTGG
jgi:hypothetical protein